MQDPDKIVNQHESLGLNNDIAVAEKRLHIQTSFVADSNEMVATVFDGGQLIERKTRKLSAEKAQNDIAEDMEQFHKEVAEEIELLFSIAGRVKKIKHAISHNRMGLYFLKRNLLDEACEEFQTAIDKERDNPVFYFNLGEAYFAKQMYANAAEEYAIAVEKGPKYADFRNRLGFTLCKQGKYLEATEHLREAIRLNKKYHEAYYNLGITLIESADRDLRDSRLPPPSERLTEAAKLFRKALQLSNNSYDRDHMKQGLRFIDERQVKSAHEEFLTAKKEENASSIQDFENEFYLKFLFGNLGNDEKLVSEFIDGLEALIEENPDYADLHNHLGVAYLIRGRNLLLRAKDEFKNALDINPKFEKADKNLKLVENDGRGFLILLRALLK